MATHPGRVRWPEVDACCSFAVTLISYGAIHTKAAGLLPRLGATNLVLEITRLLVQAAGHTAAVQCSGWIGVLGSVIHVAVAFMWGPGRSLGPMQELGDAALALAPAPTGLARQLNRMVGLCGYVLCGWCAYLDQSYTCKVLPAVCVLLLAELHWLSCLDLRSRILPRHSLLLPGLLMQLCMVVVPWLLRIQAQRQLASKQQHRAPPACKSAGSPCANTSCDAGVSSGKSDCCDSGSCTRTCKQALAALMPPCPEQLLSQTPSDDCPAGPSSDAASATSSSAAACTAACAVVQQPPSTYVSVLGPDVLPLSIKIASPYLEPEHLPHDAPMRLTHAILTASSRVGPGMQVLAVSVRHGCILLGVQALQHSLQPTAAAAAGLAQVDGGAMAMCLAQELLPGLLRDLGLAPDAASLSQLMGPGTSLSLQLGTQLLQATYEPHTGEWHTAAQKLPVLQQWQLAGTADAVRPPQLGLARQLCAVSGTDASTPVNSSSTHASSYGAAACVVLEVAVRCPAGNTGVLVSAGSAAVAAPDGCDTLQLCAQAADDFLPVRVLQQTRSADGTHIMVQVEVALQPDDGLLVAHHPGGPLAAVQPLSLQLWCGRLLLSTTHTLVSMGQAPAAAAAGAGVFGWWGIPVAGALAAAAELDVETQRVMLLQGEAGAAAQAAHQSLLRDICYWLAGVRHAACSSGWCACPLAGNASLSLTHTQLQALAHSLAQFANERGFTALHALVQQQARQILTHGSSAGDAGAAQQLSLLQRAQHAAAMAAARVHTSLVGHTCPQCEACVQQRMQTYLAPSSGLISCALGLAMATIVRRHPNATWQNPTAWLYVIYSGLHLVMGTMTLLKATCGGATLAHGSRPIRRPQLPSLQLLMPLLAYSSRVLLMVLVGTNAILRLSALQRQHQAGTWVAVQFAAVLADQLRLQHVLPQHVITALALAEAPIAVKLNSSEHSLGVCVLAALFVQLLGPLLLQLHSRARVGALPPQALLRQRHSCGLKWKHA